MLIANLFSFDQITVVDQKMAATVTINGDNGLFDGHFPSNPITPGVLQIELVKELLSTHLNRKISLKSLSRCKFLAIWDPKQTPNIEVELSFEPGEEGETKVSASGASGETVFFKFSAAFK